MIEILLIHNCINIRKAYKKLDKTEYKNRLLNIDYSSINGFKGTIVHNYTKKIIDFQLKSYYYILYNRNKLSNNSIRFINNIINKIPK